MGHSLLALEDRLQVEEASTNGIGQIMTEKVNHSSNINSEKTTQFDTQKTEDANKRNQNGQRLPQKQTSSSGLMINFITDRPLGQEERRVIYELTMKKRQSKRSTMSEKQILAKQQLARELKLERRDPIDIDSIRYATLNTTLNRSYSMILDDHYDRGPSAGSFPGEKDPLIYGAKSQSKLSFTSTCSCGCGSSLSGSDRSYGTGSNQHEGSGSSGQSGDDLVELELDTLASRKKEASIRAKRSKLEQLSAQLETRLYQYEYLVAQEKALLGSYNMMLFANKGVNNFHLAQDLL